MYGICLMKSRKKTRSKTILGYYSDVFKLMKNPSRFTATKMTGAEAIKYYLKSSAVPIIALVIGLPLASLLGGNIYVGSLGPVMAFANWLGSFGNVGAAIGLAFTILFDFVVFVPLAMLLLAGLIHLPSKLLGLLEGKYSHTLSAVSYWASTSMFFLWWLPLTALVSQATYPPLGALLALLFGSVWFLSLFYSYYVFITALSKQHNVSTLKAFGSMVVVFFVIGAISLIAIAAIAAYLLGVHALPGR